MKKVSSLLLSIILVFMLALGVHAEGSTHSDLKVKALYLNDELVKLDSQPVVVEDGIIYIALRAVLEKLDFKVTWDKEQKAAVSDKYGNVVGFKLGEKIANRNGTAIELSVEPKLINKTTYVSLDSIQSVLEIQAAYDEASGALYLSLDSSKGFFWKVEHDGAKVYLLGSIHFGNLAVYPLHDTVEEAFLESDYLAVEVNLANPVTEELTNQIQAAGMFQNGETLKDNISEDLYTRFQSLLTTIQVPVDAYDGIEPWAITQELNSLVAQLEGTTGGLGIDMYFLTKALAEEKPVIELESYISQINMFDSFSKELQEIQFEAALTSVEKLIAGAPSEEDLQIIPLLTAWKASDDDAMNIILGITKEVPEYYEKMILDRHPSMLNQLEKYLNADINNTYFVVVGALHFFGEDGLVSLLEDKGYTVEKLY